MSVVCTCCTLPWSLCFTLGWVTLSGEQRKGVIGQSQSGAEIGTGFWIRNDPSIRLRPPVRFSGRGVSGNNRAG